MSKVKTPTITKSDLIGQAAAAAGLPRNRTEKVLDALLAAIADNVDRGFQVRLGSFGVFKPVVREPRAIVVNGERMTTRRTHSVKFSPYSSLKRFDPVDRMGVEDDE